MLDLMRDRGGVAALLDGIGAIAARAPLSPNGWTVAGGVAGLAGGVAIALRAYPWAIALFALSAFCDMADGAVARRRGVVSSAGKILDVTVDKYVEGAAVLGTAWGAPPFLGISAGIWAALAVWGSVLIAVVGNAGLAASGGRKPAHWGYKLFGRGERGIVFGAGMALAWATGNERWLTIVVLAFGGVASHATALALAWGFARVVEAQEAAPAATPSHSPSPRPAAS